MFTRLRPRVTRQARSFSTIDFPYLFLNKEELVSRSEFTTKEDADAMNTYVNLPREALIKDAGEQHLKTGFCLAYISLLKAIAENDTMQIG